MRKDAREIAFKLIFLSEFNKEIDVELSFMSAIENNISKEDEEFAKLLYNKYVQNKEEIDRLIDEKLIGYERNRVYKVDLALIKLALSEILYYRETPKPVVVNEILELSKKYSTENSSKFLNGVIGAIVGA